MLSILEQQGHAALQTLADRGELPDVLSLVDIAYLWARDSGDPMIELLTQLTSEYLSQGLTGIEEEFADDDGEPGIDPETNRKGLALFLLRRREPLPKFWFSADEVEEHEAAVEAQRRQDRDTDVGKRRREQSQKGLKSRTHSDMLMLKCVTSTGAQKPNQCARSTLSGARPASPNKSKQISMQERAGKLSRSKYSR